MRYLLLLAALVAAALGYSGYYIFVARGFEDGIAGWVAQRRAEGLQAGYAGLERSGFPFRVILRLEQPRLAAPTRPARPEWRAERIAVVIQPWDLRHALIDLSGRGTLAADGADGRYTLAYDVAEGLASHQVDGHGRLLRFSAVLKRIALSEARTGMQAKLAKAELHARQPDAGAVDLVLRLQDLAIAPETWPPAYRPLAGFGPEVQHFAADLSIEGAPPPEADARAWLARWREAGGDIELHRLELTWGEVRIEAEGTLALDREMRPIGALTAKVTGYEHLLDAAVALGQMRAKDARTANSVLAILARAGGGRLSVPLTLQDGIVSLGPVPLARLAPLFPPADRNPAPPSPGPPQ